ncbi:MAG: cytochrome c3 family protein [Desulfuromonadales bacterium]
MKALRLLIGLGLVLGLITAAGAAQINLVKDPLNCLHCHEGDPDSTIFAASAHANLACNSCHVEITDIDRHMMGDIEIQEVDCARCHETKQAEHLQSVHHQSGIGCTSCHDNIHNRSMSESKKQAVVVTCTGCHDGQSYLNSVHGQGVAGGNEDAAACHDCHGLHDVTPVGTEGSKQYETFQTEACVGCHSNEEMMEHNGINPHAVETYEENYHGKSYSLGFPGDGAGCSDCHSAHGALPASDPASLMHADNRAATCAKCHDKASKKFAAFYAHGSHSDRGNYPVMYWTYVGMTGLLVGTFAVFWLHTLLWMFRGFVENREKEREAVEACNAAIVTNAVSSGSAGAAIDPGILEAEVSGYAGAGVASHAASAQAPRLYRRFSNQHIFLHITVIISFLGLSLTGLPLKFSGQEWAKTMMSFYGGVHYAGLIHRGCAILTFYYFFMALVMSFDFLFVRKDVKTRNGHQAHWLQRLFGPDSLMPNLRDIKDVTAMVKWFFFRGPKPSFERWTYWEKFDFLAVFWGMFAIGGSGLLLWFPEFFATLLPGWMFNVATIVHSDEALLATGFIFTVHFFNTHGRPEKFPMDFVIFNGRITQEEFIEERGDQWERYQEMGIAENFHEEKTSGVLYDFLLKGFGFLALFTGLGLAFLMLVAFIKG